MIKNVNTLFFIFDIDSYVIQTKEFVMLNYLKILQLLLHQLSEYLFFDDYRKRKDTAETKKCRSCLRRVSLHWNVCPFCKHSDFQWH